MKKHILIVAEPSTLPGVSVDINNYMRFFDSDIGGAWDFSEITVLSNEPKSKILACVDILRRMRLDYFIMIFGGHGCWSRQNILQVNSSGEKIPEESFIGVAERQLSIFDTCRGISSRITMDSLLAEAAGYTRKSRQEIRHRYDDRTMQAIEQQCKLYACQIGQSASDDERGGFYSRNLIGSSSMILPGEFFTVPAAHFKAKERTEKETNGRQSPQITQPRCLEQHSLIFALSNIF